MNSVAGGGGGAWVQQVDWICYRHGYDSRSQRSVDFDHHRFHVPDWVVLARTGYLVISSWLRVSDAVINALRNPMLILVSALF